MSSCNRRTFIIQMAVGASALGLSGLGLAQEQKPALTETDAYAKSMGFKLNTNDVDKAKYPKHTPEQKCSECQLFSGAPGEPLGPCSFFGKRLVPVDGWCRNFKPKGAPA
jgi:hypothetical protein